MTDTLSLNYMTDSLDTHPPLYYQSMQTLLAQQPVIVETYDVG